MVLNHRRDHRLATMKFFLLALFVAAVAAAPTPDDSQAVELIVNGVPEGEPLELGNILDIKVKETVNGQITSSSDLLHPLTAAGLAEAALAAAENIVPSPVNFEDQAENNNEVQPGPIILPEPVLPVVNPGENDLPSPIVLPKPVLPVVIPGEDDQPAPVEPVPVVPAPVEPIPVEPSPVEPSPVEPSPVEPSPVEPSPVEPSPVEPSPVEPSPVEPSPVEEPVVPVEETPLPAPQGPNEIFNDGIVQVQVNGQDAGVMSTLQSWFNLIVNYFNNGEQTSHQIV